MNNDLAIHLETIADYYVVANDPMRSKSFRSASRNVELLPFQITRQNFKDVKFQGLGEATLEVIRQFIETKSSTRLSELKENYPPKSSLSLLSLYNFDLEYILFLWTQYRASSLMDLYKVKEQRVKIALKILEELSPIGVDLPRNDYKLLGDCLVYTAFCSGRNTVNEIAEKLVEVGDKHIFLADKLQSANVLNGMSSDRLISQKQSIKDAQIKHNVRIWQGAVIDIDKDGKPIASEEVIKSLEYVVLRLSTLPHTNMLLRLSKALEYFSGSNIIIDPLDVYCTLLDKKQFKDLLNRFDPILLISGLDKLTLARIADFLVGFDLKRIALASCASSLDDLDTLTDAADLAKKLNIKPDRIINCIPKPFAKSVLIVESKIGVRYSNEAIPLQEDPAKRMESMLKKIEELRKTGNSLGHLFDKKEKK